MATSSVTTDTTNYTRIYLIVMKGGTLLTKTLFLKRVQDLSPQGQVQTVDQFLTQNRAQILSTQTGRNYKHKIYPGSGTTNLEDWDLYLFCFILEEVCALPPLIDIGRLKTIRNNLCHLHKPAINETDFIDLLDDIKLIFRRTLRYINDAQFEGEMKKLIENCEQGPLALDEIINIQHEFGRIHLEILSNQTKLLENQDIMLQNQNIHTAKFAEIQTALSLLTDIRDRNQQGADIAIPDVQVIIEVKNCSVDKETQLLDFLMEQFDRIISSPNCAIATDFPNLAMHKVSEAVYDTFRSFLTRGRHVIKVERGSLLLTIQCDGISSFVSLVRDCVDGSLLVQLKKLTDAVRAWDGCAYVNLDTGVFPDQIIDVICQLATTLNEKVPRRTFALPSLPTTQSETLSESNTLSSPETKRKRPFQSKGHMLKLTIKPETEEHREEIEKNFRSGNIDKGFERIQDQIRKVPDWANATISAKILTPGCLKTEFGKTQDSGETLTSKQASSGQSVQDGESPTTNTPSREDLRHSIESMTSIPSQTKVHSQNKRAGFIGKSSYIDAHDADIGLLLNGKEENGCDKEQEFKLSKDSNKAIENDRAPPAPVWSKEDFGFKDNKLISSAKQYQKRPIDRQEDHVASSSHTTSQEMLRCDKKSPSTPLSRSVVKISDTPIVYQKLDHFEEKFSDVLAGVVDEIGVNETIVTKRRSTTLLTETLLNINLRLKGSGCTVVTAGSKVEGTTTLGMQSETDLLLYFNGFNVIQDWGDWRFGKRNFLMIQDERTPPGYCLLQALCSDAPMPMTENFPQHHFKYSGDKIVLNSSSFMELLFRKGPASMNQRERFLDVDFVYAFHCKSLPSQATNWLMKLCSQGQLSVDMKNYISKSGCFVVPIGKMGSENKEIEWRISYALAEKCIMFNLNIVQLQCYVLMKMIAKTHLKDPGITCYICKNVFLLMLARKSIKWEGKTLFKCLKSCLHQLRNCIMNEYCPHFVVPENNLMSGRFSRETKRWTVNRLKELLESRDCGLFSVDIDYLGERLRHKFIRAGSYLPSYRDKLSVSALVSGNLLLQSAFAISETHRSLMSECYGFQGLVHALANLTSIYQQGSVLEQLACRLLAPLMSSSIGCVVASMDLESGKSVSHEALEWFNSGVQSDVTSGRLKLASVLYSSGDVEKAEIILRETDERYDRNLVTSVCVCNRNPVAVPSRFSEYSNKCAVYAVREITAFCVTFTPDEINCMPREMQYELFKSDDGLKDGNVRDIWMNWAVVDSLSYLYFLQYKIYGYLKKYKDQQRALSNLVLSIDADRNSGHRETALNLLGQCLKQENRHTEALECFLTSLNVCPRRNAAQWHIMVLLYSIFKSKELFKIII